MHYASCACLNRCRKKFAKAHMQFPEELCISSIRTANVFNCGSPTKGLLVSLLSLIIIIEALPGADCHLSEFKRSCVGALSMFHVAMHVAVRNLKKGCRSLRFHFKCCRYFFGHVTRQNLPWQSLVII